MAFAFFRKRQKMVVVIMAVLMVSFLVGAQGLTAFFGQKDGSKKVVGATKYGQLRVRDFRQAYLDLQILQRYVGLGYPRRMLEAQRIAPTDFEMLMLAQDRDPLVTYALLLHEAQQAGHKTYGAEAESFLQRIGLPKGGPARQNLIARMRGSIPVTDNDISDAAKRWLTINKSFAAARVDSPPSEQRLRSLFRDLVEQIDLRVVTIKTESLLDEVPTPSDEQIVDQFEQAKDIFAGTHSEEDPFGFGYKQPDRVNVSYFLVDQNVVARVTSADEQAVRDYYRKHTGEFMEPATTQPTTMPARQQRFSEARQEIAQKLKSEAVRERMGSLLARAEDLLEQYRTAASPDQDAYQWVASRMVKPAEAILQRELKTIEIQAQPLDQAMEAVAAAAGLQAICYPYEGYGPSRLDRAVEVTLSARSIPLAEALKRIDQQVKSDEIRWVTYEGMEDVIFPDDDSGLQPVMIGRSGLIARGGPIEDEVLANSFTSAGQPMEEVAFLVDTLAEANRTPSLARVNEDGPRMSVTGDRPGSLLWRVTEAIVAQAPEQLTEQLREEVIKDLKTKKAFDLAIEKAQQLAEAGSEKGLQQVAEQAGLETTTTGLFPRKSVSFPRRFAALQMTWAQMDQAEVLARAMMLPPQLVIWSDVPGLSVPEWTERRELVEKAFSLVPKDIEPGPGDVPYPEEPYALVTFAVPARKEAVVLQRVDYRPAVVGAFEKDGRNQLTRSLVEMNDWQMRLNWFSLEQTVERLDYKPREES